jgi:hypothetical protein
MTLVAIAMPAAVIAAAALLRGRALAPRQRFLAACLSAVAVGLSPFLLGPDSFAGRAVLSGYAISLAMKMRLLVDGRDADPEMLATLPRLLLWLAVPTATRWPRSAVEAAAARRGAGPLFLRALAAGAAMVATIALKVRLAPGPVLASPLLVLEFMFMLTALAAATFGAARLAGVVPEEAFARPVLARSPSEMWARRWNLPVTRFARHYLFVPVARRRGTAVGVLATFAASGLMHEYLALAVVSWPRYQPGFMLAFFLIQGLAVLAQSVVTARAGRDRLPTPVAIGLHVAWMLVTAPLFFRPLAPLIEAFDRTCLRLIGLGGLG